MNPKLTPEIEIALQQTPVGPIRLEGKPGAEPVYLMRLNDIAGLQELIDNRIKAKLNEADADIAGGRVEDWRCDSIKAGARSKLQPDRQ